MYIKEIELVNFKSFAEETFHFKPGTNAIIGSNGAGKTSIIEAIGWILFDYTGSYTLADIVRHNEKRASVRIKIQMPDQRVYIVRREIRVNKNKTANSEKYQVFNENNERLTTDSDVREFIKRDILKIDSGVDLKLLFKSAVGVPQGTYTSDFLLRPGGREEIFGQVLKVNEYKESAGELGKVDKFFGNKIAEVLERINFGKGQISNLDQAKEEYKSALKNEENLEKELDSLNKEISFQKIRIEELESLKNKIEETGNLLRILGEIAALELRIIPYNELKATEKDLQTELAESRQAKRQLGSLAKDLEDLRINFLAGKKNIEILQTRHEDLSHKLALENANLAIADTKIEIIEVRRGKVAQELANLQATIDKDKKFEREVKNGLCPILSQRCLNLSEGETLETYFKDSFASNSTLLSELTGELAKLGKILSLAGEIKENSTKLETAELLHNQLTENGGRLKEDEKRCMDSSANLVKLEAESADLEKSLQTLGNPAERCKYLKEELAKGEGKFLPVQLDFQNMAEQIQKVSKEHDRLSSAYKSDEHKIVEKKYSENRESEIRSGEQLKVVRREIGKLLEDIARLEETRAKLEEDARQENRLKKLKDATVFIRSKLKEAAPQIAKFLIARISYESNLLFREITGKSELTLSWRDDYEISLEEMGYDRPFATLSGGEQMAAALSVRLAILKEISDVRFAFFDEPTVNMDEENRERLAESISKILLRNRKFDQIFVISHDDTFENYVDNPVQIGQKNRKEAIPLLSSG